MVVLITTWTVAFLFAEIFGCGVHVNGYWSTQEKDFKYCSNLDTAIAAFVISSFVTDLMTLMLPIPMVSFRYDVARRSANQRKSNRSGN